MEPLAPMSKNTKGKIAMQFSIRQKPDKFRRKLPAVTGTGRTSYVEDVSLFVSFAFFVVIKYSFYNSFMKRAIPSTREQLKNKL
jgi:hypothetical protein